MPVVPCREHSVVYLGDKNALNLTFNARNRGEGGAYEAELYVILPAEADYSGVIRNHGVGGRDTRGSELPASHAAAGQGPQLWE